MMVTAIGRYGKALAPKVHTMLFTGADGFFERVVIGATVGRVKRLGFEYNVAFPTNASDNAINFVCHNSFVVVAPVARGRVDLFGNKFFKTAAQFIGQVGTIVQVRGFDLRFLFKCHLFKVGGNGGNLAHHPANVVVILGCHIALFFVPGTRRVGWVVSLTRCKYRYNFLITKKKLIIFVNFFFGH